MRVSSLREASEQLAAEEESPAFWAAVKSALAKMGTN
jgi:hypothetical protein